MLDKQEQIVSLIRSRIISEKSSRLLGQSNVVTFRVRVSATKQEVLVAVERFFEVTVESVNLLKVYGKIKRGKGHIGQRSDWKKAYVTLKKGHRIESPEDNSVFKGEL